MSLRTGVDVVTFADLPSWATPETVANSLLVFSPLILAVALLLRRNWRGTPLRPVVLLFAGVAVCSSLGAGLSGFARLGVGLVACGGMFALMRSLRRAELVDLAVREDLARLRVLEAAVAASGDGVVVARSDRSGDGLRVVYANAAFEDITGFGGQAALGMTPSVVAGGAAPNAQDAIREALRGSVPALLEVPMERSDATIAWSEWQVVPLTDETGQVSYSVAVIRDTTQRRAAEQALRESEARFRGLFEQAADAIFVIDPLGRIVDANRRACHYLGYTRDEFTHMRLTDLDAGFLFVELNPGETMTAENWYRRKDGNTVPVEVRFAAIESGGSRLKLALVRDMTRRRRAEQTLKEREELLRNVITHIPCGVFWKDRRSVYLGCNEQVARDFGHPSPSRLVGRTDMEIGATPAEAEFYRECDRRVIESGEPILNLEETQTRPNGHKATLLTSKVPMRNAAGEVVGIVGVYQDITDRKRLEEQFRQAQKMEAVGRLAGGIAHDFNNLLTIILGNTDILRDLPATTDEAPQLISEIHGAAERAGTLTRQLLTFSRRQQVRLEVLDLNEVISGLSGLLGRLLGARVAIKQRLSPLPVRVKADRGQIEQVIMNLAVNSRDAMPQGGTLTFTTECDGSAARLKVTDTGTGMTDEVRAKIFEPFFTTKGPDKGTGLGLAVVHGVVEQSGGVIKVDSTLGLGTTFNIELPACAEGLPSHTPLPVAVAERRESGGCLGSVLLVEDEDGVRRLARFVLEGHGYHVVEACDAETALELLDGVPELDLLVTDVIMPGMGGRELAERVRAMRPRIGVVFISGYVPDMARLSEVSGGVFLPKPFTPADLLRTAGKALPRVRPAAVAAAS